MSDDPCRTERDLKELLESELAEYEKLMASGADYTKEEIKILEEAKGLRPKSMIETELQNVREQLASCEGEQT